MGLRETVVGSRTCCDTCGGASLEGVVEVRSGVSRGGVASAVPRRLEEATGRSRDQLRLVDRRVTLSTSRKPRNSWDAVAANRFGDSSGLG